MPERSDARSVRLCSGVRVKKEALEIRNRMILTLKPAEYRRVMSSAQHVNLVSGDVLFEAGARISELYFLNTGMASLLSTTSEGNTIEVGMVGHEGLVGAALLLNNPQMPYRSMMQMRSTRSTKLEAWSSRASLATRRGIRASLW